MSNDAYLLVLRLDIVVPEQARLSIGSSKITPSSGAFRLILNEYRTKDVFEVRKSCKDLGTAVVFGED